jgi:hypothetical protein
MCQIGKRQRDAGREQRGEAHGGFEIEHRLSSSSWLIALLQGEQKGQGRDCHGSCAAVCRPNPGGDPCRGFAATGGHRIIPRLVANI